MKMQPIDTMGSLYSSGGLRFGGFQTDQFIELTKELENIRPGVREEIVGEAHYLSCWLHRFPEIAFFVGTLLSRSFPIGCLCFVSGHVLEMVRFYIFGASPFISKLCRSWDWTKIPLFIGAAILLWPAGKLLPIVLITFLILQGWFSFVSSVLMLPISLPILRWIYRTFGGQHPNIHNMEGMSMRLVIDRWHRELLRN
jgi:hypothetical protein